MCVALKRWVKISYSIDFTISKMLFLPITAEAIWIASQVCLFLWGSNKAGCYHIARQNLTLFSFSCFSLWNPIYMPDNKAISFPLWHLKHTTQEKHSRKEICYSAYNNGSKKHYLDLQQTQFNIFSALNKSHLHLKGIYFRFKRSWNSFKTRLWSTKRYFNC